MEIKISTPYIKLGQFLKHASLISTGGETKIFLNDNPIEVNGLHVNQRGKKLYPGDMVKIKDTVYIITGE